MSAVVGDFRRSPTIEMKVTFLAVSAATCVALAS
jgi:hypothetical protein